MRFLILLFLSIPARQLAAQAYTVIHVAGKIYNTDTREYLQTGSKVAPDARLKFETTDARAAVLSPERGRYILKPGGPAANSDSELVYVLSTVISPARGQLSTRAGGFNNKVDFALHFSSGPRAWIGPEYRVRVPAEYPMDSTRFFFVRYHYRGEAINKKLSHRGDTLVFVRDDFYAVDGRPISPAEATDLVLYYYDSASQTAREIAPLYFNVLTEAELRQMAAGVRQLPREEQEAVLQEIILSLYGQCEEAGLRAAIARALNE